MILPHSYTGDGWYHHITLPGKHRKNYWKWPSRNSGFSHQKWCLSIVFCRFTRGYAIKIWWWLGDGNYGRNDHMTVHKSSEEWPSSWPKIDPTRITWTSSPKVTVMFSETAEPTTKINLIWLWIRVFMFSFHGFFPHHIMHLNDIIRLVWCIPWLPQFAEQASWPSCANMHHGLCCAISLVITCWCRLQMNHNSQASASFSNCFCKGCSAWLTVTLDVEFRLTCLNNEPAHFCYQVLETATALLLCWQCCTHVGIPVMHQCSQLILFIFHATAVTEPAWGLEEVAVGAETGAPTTPSLATAGILCHGPGEKGTQLGRYACCAWMFTHLANGTWKWVTCGNAGRTSRPTWGLALVPCQVSVSPIVACGK